MQFISQQHDFHENSEGLVIERSQYIDPAYIDLLKAERADSMSVREGNYMRVASVPEVIVNKWLSEGYPFWDAPAKDIVAKLQLENLDDFITTNKTL